MFELAFLVALVYLLADVASRGWLYAVLSGTVLGLWRSARAALTEAFASRAESSRTLGHVASGARERLGTRAEIRRAKAERQRARRDAQDPKAGAASGRWGRSFDRAPAPGEPAGDLEPPRIPGRHGRRRRGVPIPDDVRPGETVVATPDNPGWPITTTTPAVSAAGTATEGATVTTAASPSPSSRPAGRTTVSIESVPGFIGAVTDWAAVGQQISEAGVALGITLQAQQGMVDAVSSARRCAVSVRRAYDPLVQAADATPRGAEAVTVEKARTQ